MKKSLVLAMALAMGVTASAYAANPFSDVPAGHWAYDAVDKLAAAGVIDGMGDGQFQGDRTMTRYEMAQIVAKAMAKGANVEKLAAEFADELDQLGVRVAKLEKKADNVTITGQIRYESFDNRSDKTWNNRSSVHRIRTRLFVKGQINEDWAYHARVENNQNINNNVNDGKTDLNLAYVTGKLGGVKLTAGRQSMWLADGNLYDDTMDAVNVSYGKNVKLAVYAGKPTEGYVTKDYSTYWNEGNTTYSAGHVKFEKAYGAEVSGKIGAVNVRLGYDSFRDGYNKEEGNADTHTLGNDNIWNIGVSGNIGKLYLGATYLKASNDLDKDHLHDGAYNDPSTNGYVIAAKYGAAKDAKPGSWGVYAKYYRQGVGTFIAHTMCGAAGDFGWEGFKGYQVGAEYTFAKNIRGVIEYYDLKGLESDEKTSTFFGRLQFTF